MTPKSDNPFPLLCKEACPPTCPPEPGRRGKPHGRRRGVGEVENGNNAIPPGVSLEEVRKYWDTYVSNLRPNKAAWGSPEFFAAIKPDHDAAYAGVNRSLGRERLKGKKLLELGCGIGLDTVEFAAHGADVTAIDISPVSVDLAKRFVRSRGLTVTIEVADAEHVPFDAETFDVVVARGLLMYTLDEHRVIQEIHRVLRPGGIANVSLHNRYSWYVALARLSKTNLYDQGGDPPLNKLYSIHEMRSLLAAFSRVDVSRDRFPEVTRKRGGLAAGLYNHVAVPATRCLPKALLRPFGFYLIALATK